MTVLTGNQGPVTYSPAAIAPASTGRMSTSFAGLLTVLLGAWGGIVAYVGPAFNFSADGTPAWTWTSSHTWLFLIPGAVAVVGGLCMMTARAGVATVGGLLAILAGAWSVIGPIAWPILQGSTFFSGYSTLRQFEYWVGYSLGPGVLVAMLGSFVLGRPKVAVASTVAPAPTVAP